MVEKFPFLLLGLTWNYLSTSKARESSAEAFATAAAADIVLRLLQLHNVSNDLGINAESTGPLARPFAR